MNNFQTHLYFSKNSNHKPVRICRQNGQATSSDSLHRHAFNQLPRNFFKTKNWPDIGLFRSQSIIGIDTLTRIQWDAYQQGMGKGTPCKKRIQRLLTISWERILLACRFCAFNGMSAYFLFKEALYGYSWISRHLVTGMICISQVARRYYRWVLLFWFSCHQRVHYEADPNISLGLVTAFGSFWQDIQSELHQRDASYSRRNPKPYRKAGEIPRTTSKALCQTWCNRDETSRQATPTTTRSRGSHTTPQNPYITLATLPSQLGIERWRGQCITVRLVLLDWSCRICMYACMPF